MSQERYDEFALGEEIGIRTAKYQRAKEMAGIDGLTAEEVAETVGMPIPLVGELQAEKRAEDRDRRLFALVARPATARCVRSLRIFRGGPKSAPPG